MSLSFHGVFVFAKLSYFQSHNDLFYLWIFSVPQDIDCLTVFLCNFSAFDLIYLCSGSFSVISDDCMKDFQGKVFADHKGMVFLDHSYF